MHKINFGPEAHFIFVPFVPFCGFIFVALFGRSHQQQHVRQTINHGQQGPARALELIRGCLFFSGSGAGSNSRELDVERLKLRRGAKVDFQFIQRLPKSLNARPDRRFALLVLLHDGW